MFKKLFNIDPAQNTLEASQIELTKLQKKISAWEEKANKIQTMFDFCLPDYIIDEIIENEDSQSFINLHYLINCAVVNDKLSENNAKLLKQAYSFK